MAVVFIYNQEQYRSGFNGSSFYALNSSTSEVSGFGHVRAIDGSYYTLFRTEAESGTVGVSFDRGSSPTDYTANLGIAIFNHNLNLTLVSPVTDLAVGVLTDTVPGYTSPTNLMPIGLSILSDDAHDVAAEIDLSQSVWANERYLLAQVVFGAGGAGGQPGVDADIGQLMVGDYLSIDVDPLPFDTTARLGSRLLASDAGGDGAVAFGRRYMDFDLAFDSLTSAQLTSLQGVVSAQEGQLRPFCLVTHRATVEDEILDDPAVLSRWANPWMVRFLDDEWRVAEIPGTSVEYSASIRCRRYMKDTDL